MANPVRAWYIGYTRGTENHGDEALMSIIRQRLAPEIDVDFEGENCELALLGGGTLINQSPWLIDAFECALERCGKGVVLGSGVGDLYFWGDWFGRWAPLLKRCELVGVRGPESLALLQEHGVSHARCIGDPYLTFYPPVTCERYVSKRMTVNLGSTNNALGVPTDKQFLDYVTQVLLWLKRGGWSFEWVYVWSKDGPIMEEVRRRVDPSSPKPIDARRRLFDAYSAICRSEIFLGEKLHACAMAAVCGVPFVALEYQPKVRDFAASLDMGRWVLSSAERDPEALWRLVWSLHEQRPRAAEQMVEARERLRGELAWFMRETKERAAKR